MKEEMFLVEAASESILLALFEGEDEETTRQMVESLKDAACLRRFLTDATSEGEDVAGLCRELWQEAEALPEAERVRVRTVLQPYCTDHA
ncbi:hypothetical protein KKF05_02020 [Patescibacteria group bacterium]|nr:hypothetical protein [Patescibacteria group bacterium]MBU1915650.1 hypothetical protein [Patescibacteria group bacterium]